jgi:uncharacterized protein YgiM (DUF1202 family)
MKVMNKIAFLVLLLLLLSAAAQETATDTSKVLDQKVTSLLFNQSAYNKQWVVEHQMLQEFWTKL